MSHQSLTGDKLGILLNATTDILKTELSASTANVKNATVLILSAVVYVSIFVGLWFTRSMARFFCCCPCFSFIDKLCPGPPCQWFLGPMSSFVPCKSLRRYAACRHATTAEVVVLVLEIAFTVAVTWLFGSGAFAKVPMTPVQLVIVFMTFMPFYVILRISLAVTCCCCCKKHWETEQRRKKKWMEQDDDDESDDDEEDERPKREKRRKRQKEEKSQKKKHKRD